MTLLEEKGQGTEGREGQGTGAWGQGTASPRLCSGCGMCLPAEPALSPGDRPRVPSQASAPTGAPQLHVHNCWMFCGGSSGAAAPSLRAGAKAQARDGHQQCHHGDTSPVADGPH